MSSYYLRSQRHFSEKNGKLKFRLRGINSEEELKKHQPGEWVKFLFEKDSLCRVNGGSAVYAISIVNIKTKKEDICYIGSSKSVPVRLHSHKVLSFLNIYLCNSFSIYVHILYIDNIRTIENKLISTIFPFLNARIPQARSFPIGKKEVRKLKYKK